jgi:hypothetical protein
VAPLERSGLIGRASEGASGGFRAIYFFLTEPGRIYMAAVYAKSRKESLSASDQKVPGRLAAQIKKAARAGHNNERA